MSAFVKSFTSGGYKIDSMKISFNKSAGVANLHGSWGVSSTGWSYKFTARPDLDTESEIHLELEEIEPEGTQFWAEGHIPVNENFIVTGKTTDVFLHITRGSFSDSVLEKKELGILRCHAMPG